MSYIAASRSGSSKINTVNSQSPDAQKNVVVDYGNFPTVRTEIEKRFGPLNLPAVEQVSGLSEQLLNLSQQISDVALALGGMTESQVTTLINSLKTDYNNQLGLKLDATATAVNAAMLENLTKAEVVNEARTGLATQDAVSAKLNLSAMTGATASNSASYVFTTAAVKTLLAAKLDATAKAANSEALGGHNASYFAPAAALTTETRNRSQGDTNTLNSAKSYTNSKAADEASARSSGDTSTLNAAKAYTDALALTVDRVRNEGLPNVVEVKTGYRFTLYRTSDDRLFVSGMFNDWNLPVGANGRDVAVPEEVVMDYSSPIKTWDTGSHNAFVLKENGELWSWGRGDDYQQPTGTVTDVQFATLQMTGVQELVVSSQRSYDHNYSMQYIKKADGLWYGWGRNSYGRLGNGSTAATSTPTLLGDLPDGGTIAKLWAIGTNIGSTYALSSKGNLYGCGANCYGSLGIGVSGDTQSSWKLVVGFEHSLLKDITGGRGDSSGNASQNPRCVTFFLLSDGSVYACGASLYGALGTTLTGDSSLVTPTKVPGLPAIDSLQCTGASGMAVYALDRSNYLWVWGYTLYGQLGIGSTSSAVSTPVKVDFPSAVAQVAIPQGYCGHSYSYVSHAFVLLENGDLYSAGIGGYGCLGLGNSVQTNTFTKVPFYGEVDHVTAVHYGSKDTNNTFVFTKDGKMYGCGYAGYNGNNGFLSGDNATNYCDLFRRMR